MKASYVIAIVVVLLLVLGLIIFRSDGRRLAFESLGIAPPGLSSAGSDPVTAIATGSGSVILPPDTVEADVLAGSEMYIPCVSSGTASVVLPADTVRLDLSIVETDDSLIPVAAIDGIPVVFDSWTVVRRRSPWDPWRVTFSIVPRFSDPPDPDFALGVAHRLIRPSKKIWIGAGLSIGIPSFAWIGAGARGGYLFTDHLSLDGEIGYRFGDLSGGYVAFGVSASF